MTKFNNSFRNLFTKVVMFGIGMIFTVSAVNGQTDLSNPGSVFTQDFNTGTTLTSVNFTMQDVNNDASVGSNPIWALRSTETVTLQGGGSQVNNIGRGGSGGCAAYRWNAAAAANDWLFSSSLTLKAGNQYRIRYHFANYQGFAEKMRFFIGTGNTAASYATATALFDHGNPISTAINNTPAGQNTYSLQELTFTPTADGTYYMVWQAYSDADQWLLRLDDISMENVTPVPNDISVMSVTTTATVANCGSFTATTPFTVKVRNTGTNAQTNIPVNFSATRNGTALPAITSQTIPSLAANAEVDLTVNIDASAGGTYILTATSALANDENTANNVRSFTVFNPLMSILSVGTSVTQNFNTLPIANAGWAFSPVGSLGVAAAAPNPAVPAVSGWLSVTGVANSTPAAMLALRSPTAVSNSWLFSNCMPLESGVSYRFSYFRRAFSSPDGATTEKLRVYIGITANTNMTTQLIPNGGVAGDELITNTTYTEVFYDFTPSASGVYYVGFNHISDASLATNAGLLVDDFTVLNVPPVDVAVTSVTTAASVANCGSFSATTAFTVKVRNTGTSAQTNIPVNFSATRNGTALPAITSQTIPSLAANAEVDLTVNIDANVGGTYILTATSALANDGNTANNTRTFTVFNPLADLTTQNTTSSNNFTALLASAGWSVNPTPITGSSGWSSVNIGTPANGVVLGARNATAVSNDWLFSNCLTLQQNRRYRVSYQRAAFNNSNPVVMANAEKLRMFISGANTPASMTATNQVLPVGQAVAGDETFTNTALTTVTYEYTHTVTTGVYYVGIQQTSDAAPAGFPTASRIGILIDNFSITAIPDVDLAMRRFVTPFPVACGGFTATTPITARVWNAGSQPINTNDYTFSYRVRDASASNADITLGVLETNTFTVPAATIAAGDSLALPAFNVNMSLPRYYLVDVFITSTTPDGNIQNNLIRTAFVNGYRDLSADNAVYSENFSSRLDVAWTALNQSTVTGTGSPVNWGYSTTAGFGAGGSGGFFWAWPGTTAPANATLFSPCMNLVTGKVYDVNFKHRLDVAGTAKARLLLVRSNDAAGITNATLLRDYNNITTLTHVTVPTESFVVPTNGSYYLAIQLYSDGNADQPALIIDDFSVTNTGPLQPPAAPATLTATAAPLQVDLSWSASTSTGVTAPTSYRIDFSTTDANTGFTSLPIVNAPATTFSHTNLTAGTQYFYRVYATNSAGTSTLFAAGSATPTILAAPTNLVIATQTTANALTLNWTASPTATGYDIERATVTGGTPGAYTSVGTPSNTSFNNTGLVTGTVYAYRVRASKGTPLQYSAYSNVVTSAAVLELDQTAFGKQIVVSPNPTDGNFKVDMRNVKPNRVTFIITDLNGKEVHRSVGENEDSFDFNVTGVSKGTYLLYINADKGQSVKKVVIK